MPFSGEAVIDALLWETSRSGFLWFQFAREVGCVRGQWFFNTAMAAVGSPSRKKNKLFRCIGEEMQLLLQLFQQNPDDAFKVFPELTLILLSGQV